MAEVRAVEWLGHERHVVCTLDGEPITVRETGPDGDPAPGQRVHLAADADQVHLFDAATGIRR
jgi:ABC-type sugar transport system ATPase subunit